MVSEFEIEDRMMEADEKATAETLAKVAEVAKKCPNFYDWDDCQEICLLYLFCDGIEASHDVSKIVKK